VSLPPDGVLVAALRAGDEVMFASLLDAWSSSMLRLARSFVSTHASAEEVVQDTWLAVLIGLHGFEGRSAFRTWVYRILVSTAKKRGTREKRSVPWSSVAPDGADGRPTVDPARFRGPEDRYPGGWREFPAAWASPEDVALSGEIQTVLAAILAELPGRQRAVIVLRDVSGHTAQEVCDLLDLTQANQRVLLHRARAAVRERLAGYLAKGVAHDVQ
jgi:RNA polymerase sigma-70 factor (ECF subfamily)